MITVLWKWTIVVCAVETIPVQIAPGFPLVLQLIWVAVAVSQAPGAAIMLVVQLQSMRVVVAVNPVRAAGTINVVPRRQIWVVVAVNRVRVVVIMPVVPRR